MKHLEDTPWWICDEGDYNFCAYVDTDSNYFNAEPLLRHLYPNFDEMSEKEKDNVLEKEALKYQDPEVPFPFTAAGPVPVKLFKLASAILDLPSGSPTKIANWISKNTPIVGMFSYNEPIREEWREYWEDMLD